MIEDGAINGALTEFNKLFTQQSSYRALLILVFSMVIAYWLSHFVAKFIVRIAQAVSVHSDKESNEDRLVRLRQVETYLSVTVAAVRALIVAIVGYWAWKLLLPNATSGIAAIGAGTFFIVFAGQTLGSLLRDITAGFTMIIEKWFNVGDFVKIEPFMDVAGVVERFTLRSTRLRTLSGEVVWIHNQQIMAVHVTPRALRTLAVDVFVHDRVKGEKAIEAVIDTVPTGPTLLARPLRIKSAEKWGDSLWRITVIGQTPPGREWLVDKYFVDVLKDIDADKEKKNRLIKHEPIVRFDDPRADRRFKRAIRTHED